MANPSRTHKSFWRTIVEKEKKKKNLAKDQIEEGKKKAAF